MNRFRRIFLVTSIASSLMYGCENKTSATAASSQQSMPASSSAGTPPPAFASEPLINTFYTADPSAHVFGGKIYIYPSHDVETNIKSSGSGDQFDMKDVHVLSIDAMGGAVKDNGEAIHLRDVPWASRQLWAPEAAEKNGQYFLYFAAKDKADIFRIGVGTSDSPIGPFKSLAAPIADSMSVDPAVFKDSDGNHYMYFGGMWGGQLQRWATGTYNPADIYPEPDQPALSPKVAKLNDNMLGFAEKPRDVQILDQEGKVLKAGDTSRRFFEGSWLHKYKGQYYFSYSTGDTHNIAYAIGDNPYGPFTYKGIILEPVLGWTSQHSIIEFQNKWYLFYHDSSLSGGQTHLRSVKVTELHYNSDGTIQTLSAFQK